MVLNISMLTKTSFNVSLDTIEIAKNNLPSDEFRLTINKPTGDFFYDPWIIKDEYKNTVWETILKSLGTIHGEARIILLDEGNCYQSHSDIDNRYHLNISGTDCYIADLLSSKLHQLKADGHWYYMDAGKKHSAANFGRGVRAQLVVRCLLLNGHKGKFVPVTIESTLDDKEESRYRFDMHISPELNKQNKYQWMRNFKILDASVSFEVSSESLSSLRSCIPEGFILHE